MVCNTLDLTKSQFLFYCLHLSNDERFEDSNHARKHAGVLDGFAQHTTSENFGCTGSRTGMGHSQPRTQCTRRTEQKQVSAVVSSHAFRHGLRSSKIQFQGLDSYNDVPADFFSVTAYVVSTYSSSFIRTHPLLTVAITSLW